MSNVTVEEIVAFTAEVFGLPEAALTHPAVRLRSGVKGPRDVPVGQALNIATWLARRHTQASFPTIARAFGRRDHSSLVTGAAGIDVALPRSDALRAVVDRIEALIDTCHEGRQVAAPPLERQVQVAVRVHHHPTNDASNPALSALVAAAVDQTRKATA